MFMQFMHVGRIANSANRYTGEPPVAPSAVSAAGQMWTDAHGLQDLDTPRALETSEIPGVIEDFAQATRNALAAGFDGVELHAASGYLPMQFLSTGTNKRTDAYGGSVQNRIRFVVETLEAMIAAAGASGQRRHEDQPGDAVQRHPRRRPDRDLHHAGQGHRADGPRLPARAAHAPIPNIFELLRPLYPGTFAAGGAFDFASGNAAIASGLADFIVFGKPFTSNPDLPERFAGGLELTPFDATTFYTPGPKGYIDYPAGIRAERVGTSGFGPGFRRGGL